ncbi:MAG: MATE family efflux transporter [Bacteroidales bacterium]|nr:MATE family efflux transporter [Bacteroidales bacterium]
MNRDTLDFKDGKISSIFRKLLIPTMFGALSICAVTAIDGIFIGHGVGADGIAAINIFVPIFQIMAGFGLMVGMGCSVASSIHLSQNNIKAAKLNVTQAIIIASAIVAIFATALILFPEFFGKLLGSSPTLLPQVMDYIVWLMPSFVFQMWSMIGLFIIRLDGSPKYAMWCNIIPASLNVLLDWVFIFPLGMGVKGAAIATGISIIFGGIMAIYYLLFRYKTVGMTKLKWSRTSLKLSLRNFAYHCKIGSSTLLGELTLAVLIFVGNLIFMHYLGDAGVGAFGIACYYMPFFFMVGNAIAQSAQPIISYNYGIERWKEIKEARALLLKYSVVSGILVSALFFFFPKELVILFVDSHSQAGEIAINGFPYLASGILFFILNVAIIGYYQSIEEIKRATWFVLLRGFIVLIPSFILLPIFFGEIGMWLAMPVAELITLGVVAVKRVVSC